MTTIKNPPSVVTGPLSKAGSASPTKPTGAPPAKTSASGGWLAAKGAGSAPRPVSAKDNFERTAPARKMVGAGTPFVTPDIPPDDEAPKKIVGAGTPFVTPDIPPDDEAPKKIVGAGTPFVTPEMKPDGE